MFRLDVANADLLKYEKSLSTQYFTGSSNWDEQIERAKVEIIRIFKNQGIKTRNLCVPFFLAINTLSNEEPIERSRLILNVTEIPTADVTFTLYGAMGENDTLISLGTIAVTIANGVKEYTLTFELPYKYFKLIAEHDSTDVTTANGYEITTETDNKINYTTIEKPAGTTLVKYASFLTEQTFELIGIYCSLWFIFRTLENDPGSVYEKKADDYKALFETALAEIQFPIDTNEDNAIDTETELGANTNARRIFR